MTQANERRSYRTQRDVVLFLEWGRITWDESKTAMDLFSRSDTHVFAAPARNAYITISGPDREKIEWVLLEDDGRINRKALGLPVDLILKNIPYEIVTEFDEMLYSFRCSTPLGYEPSLFAQEWWVHLTGEPFLSPSVPRPKPEPKPKPELPKHVQIILKEEAIRTKKDCPITMNPITLENSSVTLCGHIFTTEALRTWLETNTNCPECRTVI